MRGGTQGGRVAKCTSTACARQLSPARRARTLPSARECGRSQRGAWPPSWPPATLIRVWGNPVQGRTCNAASPGATLNPACGRPRWRLTLQGRLAARYYILHGAFIVDFIAVVPLVYQVGACLPAHPLISPLRICPSGPFPARLHGPALARGCGVQVRANRHPGAAPAAHLCLTGAVTAAVPHLGGHAGGRDLPGHPQLLAVPRYLIRTAHPHGEFTLVLARLGQPAVPCSGRGQPYRMLKQGPCSRGKLKPPGQACGQHSRPLLRCAGWPPVGARGVLRAVGSRHWPRRRGAYATDSTGTSQNPRASGPGLPGCWIVRCK
jgi:hypothetical protein